MGINDALKSSTEGFISLPEKKVERHEGNLFDLHYVINPRKIQFNKTGETHVQVKGQNWDAPRKQQKKTCYITTYFVLSAFMWQQLFSAFVFMKQFCKSWSTLSVVVFNFLPMCR